MRKWNSARESEIVQEKVKLYKRKWNCTRESEIVQGKVKLYKRKWKWVLLLSAVSSVEWRYVW